MQRFSVNELYFIVLVTNCEKIEAIKEQLGYPEDNVNNIRKRSQDKIMY
jgi:hypothetical protein